jgi:hypothetical protein
MANTTFNGPVRSENGFKVVSKNETTGAFTTSFTIDASGVQVAPVSVADGNATIAAATNGGRINLVPAPTQDNTYTLPAPEAGIAYRFVFAGAAAASFDAIFDTGDDANFFIGAVTFLDTDNEVSVVGSDGNSNSIFQINVPAAFDVTFLGLDDTNYQIFGTVTSATAPAFADQTP